MIHGLEVRVGYNSDRDIILVFHVVELITFIIEQIGGDIKRQSTFNPLNLFSAGPGVNAPQLEKCQRFD